MRNDQIDENLVFLINVKEKIPLYGLCLEVVVFSTKSDKNVDQMKTYCNPSTFKLTSSSFYEKIVRKRHRFRKV